MKVDEVVRVLVDAIGFGHEPSLDLALIYVGPQKDDRVHPAIDEGIRFVYACLANNRLDTLQSAWEEVDLTLMPIAAMLSLLTGTFSGHFREKLPMRPQFVARIRSELKRRGESNERIERLVGRE